MQPNNFFIKLTYISLLPLFFALLLSIYQVFNLSEYTGYIFSFARINSYIYAHSYGALLLVLLRGIQIGQNIQGQNRLFIIFNFIILLLAWVSYQSFADSMGMLLLMSCWLAALIIDLKANQHHDRRHWYGKFKIKINILALTMLFLLTLINNLPF